MAQDRGKGIPTGYGVGTTRTPDGELRPKNLSVKQQKEAKRREADFKKRSSSAKQSLEKMIEGVEGITPSPSEPNMNVLATEIGPVPLTEDLLLGFNDAPAPTTYDEAWDMVVDAADRLTRVMAITGTRTGMTLKELEDKAKKMAPRKNIPDVADTKEVVDIIKERGEDPELDKIVAAFERDSGEDKESILYLAEAYTRFLNGKRSLKGDPMITESNLESAIKIVSGVQGHFSDHNFPLDLPRAYKGTDGLTRAEKIKKTLDTETLNTIQTSFSRSPETPFMEECNGGIRINITDTESLELVARETGITKGDPRWETGVRRTITKNNKRLVVADGTWASSPSGKGDLIGAADFRRVLPDN